MAYDLEAELMASRFVIVLYGLCLAWLVFWWFATGSGDPQYKFTSLVIGLPPLALLVLVRFFTAGRLP